MLLLRAKAESSVEVGRCRKFRAALKTPVLLLRNSGMEPDLAINWMLRVIVDDNVFDLYRSGTKSGKRDISWSHDITLLCQPQRRSRSTLVTITSQ